MFVPIAVAADSGRGSRDGVADRSPGGICDGDLVAGAVARLWQVHGVMVTMGPGHAMTRAADLPGDGAGACEPMMRGQRGQQRRPMGSAAVGCGRVDSADSIIHSVAGSVAVTRGGKHAGAAVNFYEVPESRVEQSNGGGLGRA